MHNLDTTDIPVEQVEDLEKFANEVAGPELRDVLLSLSHCIRDGSKLAVIDGSVDMTPREVAERLGMSRSHLYKLLDRGEIMSHRVGRDRRIRLDDLIAFETQRQQDRRELAQRFAHQQSTHSGAIDEIADLL